MKKLIAIFICLFLVAGCDSNNSDSALNSSSSNNNLVQNYSIIDAVSAHDIIENEDVVIIDVRSKNEYNTGYIENAINIPVDSIQYKIGNIVPDKDKKILLYCRSGARAQEAAKKLASLGYSNVYSFGGIVDWPYEIVN